MILILIIISGIAAAFFATQNTQVTSITFATYTVTNIPVYLIALTALLAGILLFWIVNLIRSFSMGLSMRGKEQTISETRKENVELAKEIHKLEIENTRLKTQLGEEEKDQNAL
jgi:uncharacterized integral membrane protein